MHSLCGFFRFTDRWGAYATIIHEAAAFVNTFMKNLLFFFFILGNIDTAQRRFGDFALGAFEIGDIIAKHKIELIGGCAVLLLADVQKAAQHILGHTQCDLT